MAFLLNAPSSYLHCTFNKSQDFLMGICYHAVAQSYKTSPLLDFLLCSFSEIHSTCLGNSATPKLFYDLCRCVTWMLPGDLHQTKSFVQLAQDTVG